jgi:Family of unknown function (DUF6461)
MSSERWDKYAWLDEEPLNDDLMAGCLGVVLGLEEATVRQTLAVDEGSRRDVTVHEAWRMSETDFGNDLVQVSSIGQAVVTFEPNGWHGVESELVIALSQGGPYVAYFWNVNAVMQFVFAEAGAIQRDFDPLLYDSDGERGRALPEEVDLPFPSAEDRRVTPGRAALALIERLTAVEIARAWLLEEPHATYRVDPEPR